MKGFTKCPGAVLTDYELAPMAKLTYWAYLSFAKWRDVKPGATVTVWPGNETVAKVVGCSESSVKRHRARLVEAGYMSQDRRRFNSSTVWNVHVPEERTLTSELMESSSVDFHSERKLTSARPLAHEWPTNENHSTRDITSKNENHRNQKHSRKEDTHSEHGEREEENVSGESKESEEGGSPEPLMIPMVPAAPGQDSPSHHDDCTTKPLAQTPSVPAAQPNADDLLALEQATDGDNRVNTQPLGRPSPEEAHSFMDSLRRDVLEKPEPHDPFAETLSFEESVAKARTKEEEKLQMRAASLTEEQRADLARKFPGYDPVTETLSQYVRRREVRN